MPNQNVGTVYLCMHKQEMQFFYYLLACARSRPTITPSIACSIIGADACEACHPWLDLAPIKRGFSQSCIKYHRWTARPCTVDMEPVAPDIHQFARRGGVRSVNRAGKGLRAQPEQQKSDEGQTEYAQETQETPTDRRTGARRNGGRALPTVDGLCHFYVSFAREDNEREEHTLFM